MLAGASLRPTGLNRKRAGNSMPISSFFFANCVAYRAGSDRQTVLLVLLHRSGARVHIVEPTGLLNCRAWDTASRLSTVAS